MGWHVTAEVFERSRQKGGKLLILLALAENADNEDGVVFGIDQGWPKKERNVRKQRQTIAGKARLNAATVSRLLAELAGPIDDELEIRWVQDGQARTAVYRITVGRYRTREVDYERLTKYRQRIDTPFSTTAELAKPWSERPGNTLRTTQELPDEMSGSSEGDYLTESQVPPDISSGDHLTSTSGDTSTPRARVVKEISPERSVLLCGRQGVREEVETLLEEKFGKVAAHTNAAGKRGKAIADLLELGATADSVRYAFNRADYDRRWAVATDIAFATHYPNLATGYTPRPAEPQHPAGDAELQAETKTLGPLDDIKLTEVVGFVERVIPLGADRVQVSEKLRRFKNVDREARAALLERVDAARGETAIEAYRRWIEWKAADAEFSLDEIAAVVATWDDLDDVDRQELLDRADEIRSSAVAGGKAAAA